MTKIKSYFEAKGTVNEHIINCDNQNMNTKRVNSIKPINQSVAVRVESSSAT